jgi:hypothetical protein
MRPYELAEPDKVLDHTQFLRVMRYMSNTANRVDKRTEHQLSTWLTICTTHDGFFTKR